MNIKPLTVEDGHEHIFSDQSIQYTMFFHYFIPFYNYVKQMLNITKYKHKSLNCCGMLIIINQISRNYARKSLFLFLEASNYNKIKTQNGFSSDYGRRNVMSVRYKAK